ncbi:hypothetical protein [Planococcus sp. CAU13]|uniref:hypothetical protein n=1 Tax=Planococcus sp. CAU13 TaxID=1541197 RepID=UPI00052FFEC1|nr:hypothetical protein [Planococcus sp. CAU13]
MKRFITIALVTGALLISVTSFASSDGGQILKGWYDRAFGYVVEEAVSEFLTGVIGLNRTISQEKKEQMDEAEDELGKFSLLKTENSVTEMQRYQQQYIEVANKTEEKLKKQNLTAEKNKEISNLESELEDDVEAILKELLQ